LTILAVAVFFIVTAPAQAQGPASFDKAFIPDTIGSGSVSTLRFDIANSTSAPVSDLAFTDVLPAGVVIASPANAVTFCGGTLSAPAGGGTITFSDGVVGAFGSCSISVDVTSGTGGVHTNTSGDLTSSAGNSGTATADLTVAANRPGFTKSFAPSSVPLGGRSTLTFTIDNTANTSAAFFLTFADTLPLGMVVAGPANGSTTCAGGTLTAAPGSGIISLSGGSVAAAATCTVSVDVVGGAVGLLDNTSGDLTSSSGGSLVSSGKAAATLEVTVDPIALVKQFIDDPVPPGSTVNLEFTLFNIDRNDSATNITFTDDLDATLSGLVATGLPAAGVCGAGSQLSGTGVLTLTGGNLAPGSSCTFTATLQVPVAAPTGIYPNTTSSVTADVGGAGIVGSPAADLLFVAPAPTLTKEFIDDPVGAGDSVTLDFTITNTSSAAAATNIAFVDVFYVGLPTALATPAVGFCGAGSTATFTPLVNPAFGDAIPASLTVTGASLAAAASCTFSITLDVAPGVPSGTYPNATTPITATVGGEPVVGNPATDDLVVVGGPRLLKEFTDDPAQPGGTVTLEFTLSHDEVAPADATNITFADDLDATLSGLAAVGLPMNDICGAGSQISGTTSLTFTGGSLAPGDSCTFSVTLQVPGTAPSGSHTNTTSGIAATVSGITAIENPASDDLMIAGLVLTKEFVDDPALPGGNDTLQFTIENISPIEDATNIAFTDALNSVITGLTPTGLPLSNVCGAGSSLSAVGNTLSVAGGNLLAGELCTFSVVLTVPGAAISDSYINGTSGLSALMNGSPVVFPGAADLLVVSAGRLSITKSFTDDPVAPGDTATLEFTLTNLDPSQAASAITFTDDLGAALAGLTLTSLLTDTCGGTVGGVGTTNITVSGVSLAAGGQCTISLAVQVPVAAPAGSHTNVTSQVTGTIGGFGVTGDPAADDLSVNPFTFSKAFGGPVPAGGATTLDFTIVNLDASTGAVGIEFTDDLDAVVPGMVAVGLPAADVCGPGSVLAGTSIITLTGGNLGPGGSCTFSVDVQVPSGAPEGTYVNTTSDLSQGGIASAAPATADVVVEAALAGVEIPSTTPLGTLVLVALIAAAALWRLRWRG
jgi:acyl dehydratase